MLKVHKIYYDLYVSVVIQFLLINKPNVLLYCSNNGISKDPRSVTIIPGQLPNDNTGSIEPRQVTLNPGHAHTYPGARFIKGRSAHSFFQVGPTCAGQSQVPTVEWSEALRATILP